MWMEKAILQAKTELERLENQTVQFNLTHKSQMHRLPPNTEKSYLNMIDRKVSLRGFIEKASIMQKVGSGILGTMFSWKNMVPTPMWG